MKPCDRCEGSGKTPIFEYVLDEHRDWDGQRSGCYTKTGEDDCPSCLGTSYTGFNAEPPG